MKFDELPQPETRDIVSPDTLAVDGDNPNEQSDEMFGLLCDNMRTKGWLGNDIIADTDGLIADGEHRWRAAQEIGLEGVPVKFFDIDDSERRLWRQELNKISGEHDTKRDALEYQTLLDNGKSESVDALVDATDEDLDELLEEIRMDKSTPAPYEYDCEHTVYFEDCVQGMQDRLDDDSVDMVFTSPPYNVEKKQSGTRVSETVDYTDDRTKQEFRDFLASVFSEVTRVLKPEGHLFVNLDHNTQNGTVKLNSWIADLISVSLKSYIVWDKMGASTQASETQKGRFYPSWEPIYHFSETDNPLNSTKCSDVWSIDVVRGGTRENDVIGEHPAPFPVELVKKAIESTTSEGDTILDPFMGSGTTAVAAIQNNRDYVGFEIDEKGAYKPIVERRISEAKRQVNANAN
jgi:DNA modification methylase